MAFCSKVQQLLIQQLSLLLMEKIIHELGLDMESTANRLDFVQETKSVGAEVNWGVRFNDFKDVRLHLLTAVVKCFFRRPHETQKALGAALAAGLSDSHQGVHDRALFYYRLLQYTVSVAECVVNPPKQAVSVFADTQSSEIKDRIFNEFNSLSVIYQKTIFLPVVGLVDPDKLKPGDLVGVYKDSYLILDTLPSEYDSRVKAMEVDEKPTEDYNDIGGLEKQMGLIPTAMKRIGLPGPEHGQQLKMPWRASISINTSTSTSNHIIQHFLPDLMSKIMVTVMHINMLLILIIQICSNLRFLLQTSNSFQFL